ncbi:MAG: Npt1/Npt2 family nucleotide transporter, partial [Cytophagales bacterium]
MNSSSGIPSRNLCIHRQKRFWVLCSLKFLVSFLFVILKIQKKNNVVIGMGAEKLNHFKTIVFIIMVGSVFFYTYLVGKFKQERLFYGILVMFLIAFSLYSFVLLPNLEKLQPQYATSWLACHEGSKGNFAYSCMMIWKNWVSVFFFCIAEFWGQYCIIILFWGVANELFSRQEAKKTYHYFIASGCFGGVAGTLLLRWVAQDLVGKSQEDQFLGISNLVGLTSIATTLTLLCLYHWIKRVFFNQKQVKKPQKSPHSFSFAKG